MRADFVLEVGSEDLFSDNPINKDTVTVREVKLVGKPKFFIEPPHLVDPDGEGGKEFYRNRVSVRLQVSPSGTLFAQLSPVEKSPEKHLESPSTVAADSKPGRTSEAPKGVTERVNETRAKTGPNTNVFTPGDQKETKSKGRKSVTKATRKSRKK